MICNATFSENLPKFIKRIIFSLVGFAGFVETGYYTIPSRDSVQFWSYPMTIQLSQEPIPRNPSISQSFRLSLFQTAPLLMCDVSGMHKTVNRNWNSHAASEEILLYLFAIAFKLQIGNQAPTHKANTYTGARISVFPRRMYYWKWHKYWKNKKRVNQNDNANSEHYGCMKGKQKRQGP